MRSVWLMYHNVWASAPDPDVPRSASMYHISLALFAKQLRAIRLSGCPAITVGEFLKSPREDRTVVITFDDGWMGAFKTAIPLLREEGMPATFFITRDFVGKKWFCDREMILSAARAGMEIGIHGTSHRMLSGCTPQEILAEIQKCKWYLESLLGRAVEVMSLPGGDVNSRIISCAQEAGVCCICNSTPGVNRHDTSRFHLNRLAIRDNTTEATVARFCRFRVMPELARWALLRTPKKILGMRNYALLRRAILGERQTAANQIFRP